MKMMMIALLALSSSLAEASENCALQAESHLRKYIVSGSYTQPGQLMGQTAKGDLIYAVRTNLFGGEAQYEVVLTPHCAYLSHRLLWAE